MGHSGSFTTRTRWLGDRFDRLASAADEERARGALALAERGWLPDALIRMGIRRLCAERLCEENAGGPEAASMRIADRLEALRTSPLAIETDAANRQHYELPPRFFELCLGPQRKYSACYWDPHTADLGAAEERMLELYAARAQLADGQEILDLGCGWGSLSLWLAARYPGSEIKAISNSRPQREFIEARCRELGIRNLRVFTRDVNELTLPARQFDRIVSIEMFEHLRNYQNLLERIATWLKPGGKLFVHIFCHRDLMYPFETEGATNWMGRHFFTGGLMPAADTLMHFQGDLLLEERWKLSGTHYEKTSNAWLDNHDRHTAEILEIFADVYGRANARVWNQRWRMFWMACAELFGYADGNEWLVAHYRFGRRALPPLGSSAGFGAVTRA